MKKQDILNVKSKFDVMKTLKIHPELWDEEVDENLKSVARQYLVDNYGEADVIVDPLSTKKSPDS